MIYNVLYRGFSARENFLKEIDLLRERYPNRPIAFVLSTGGFFEFLGLKLFLRHKYKKDFRLKYATLLPDLYVEGFFEFIKRLASTLKLRKKEPSRIEQCSQELKKKQPILILLKFWESRKIFNKSPGEKTIAFLKEKHPDLVLVPLLFIWRKGSRKEELKIDKLPFYKKLLHFLSLPILWAWDFFLGDALNPTELRKFIILLRQYPFSTLRCLPALEVNKEDAATLRRKMLMQVSQSKRTALGPVYQPTKHIADQIFQNKNFLQFLDEQSKENSISLEESKKQALEYLHEMAAKFTPRYIELVAKILSPVFNRIYNGIDFLDEDIEKLREASKRGPLLFIPNHSSYIDFLVLSYVLFRLDIAPPHIAAGINLNIWPIGNIFRNCGAFFLRRSFKSNKIYKEVFRRYLGCILNNRYNMEFFIEGTRSRSGKLAPPKYGMLNMLFDAYSDRMISEDARIVPVSITYDHVTEDNAHSREQEGGIKPKENLYNIFRSSKVLFKNHGKVYLRFANDFSLKDRVNSLQKYDENYPAKKKEKVYKCTFHICSQINQVRPVTAAGLVANLLMAQPRKIWKKNDFCLALEKIKNDLAIGKVNIHRKLKENLVNDCLKSLKILVKNGLVKEQTIANEKEYFVEEKQLQKMLFRKNTAIHSFVNWGVRALCAKDIQLALELRKILEFEFFFESKDQYWQQISSQPDNISYDLYGHFIVDTLDTQKASIMCLKEMTNLHVSIKEWEKLLQKRAKLNFLRYNITHLHSLNSQAIKNFIKMCLNKSWLVPSQQGSELYKFNSKSDIDQHLNRLNLFYKQLKSWPHVEYLLKKT